jgi:CBS domain-containing protein
VKWTKAKDLMSTDVKTIDADWPVNRVAEFLVAHDISGAPVVRDGELVGVVSLTDLARHDGTSGEPAAASDAPPEFYRTETGEGFSRQDMEALQITEDDSVTAADLMTPEVYDVNEHTSVQQVAQVMLRGRIHRVFVTERGQIRGIITAHDMLRVVADL